MYLPELLNDQGLYQHIGGLIEAAGPDLELNSKASEYASRATASCIYLQTMKLLGQACLDVVVARKHEFSIKREIVIWSPLAYQLMGLVTPCLASLRVMQDLALPLCARAAKLKQLPPKSLAEAVRSLHRLNLDQATREEILAYWNRTGRVLKDYRDMDTHYHAIARYVVHLPTPTDHVIVLLPDEPADRSRARAEYAKRISALDFMKRSFDELHDLVDGMMARLGYEPAPFRISIEFGPLGVPMNGVRQTMGVVFDDVQGTRGVEIGQVEDRRVYMRQFFPPQPTHSS